MIYILNIVTLVFLVTSYILVSAITVLIMIIVRSLFHYNHNLRDNFTLKIKKLFLSITVTLLGVYFVHPTYFCYDKRIPKTKRCIVLSNHLTNYDWIYILVLLNMVNLYDDVVVISKESLAGIPIFGYGMKAFGYIFLKRNWSDDRNVLADGLKRIRDKDKFNILLFPEGTIIETGTHSKSKRFCEEKNVVIDGARFNPENVILPRKTGFEMIYQNLDSLVEGIVDITIFVEPYMKYPSETFTMWDVFIKRNKKFRINAIVELYESNQTTKKEEWIYRLYKDKDSIVQKYKDYDQEINTMLEFVPLAKKLVKKDISQYEFKTAYIWCRCSKFYYTMLFLITSFLLFLIANTLFYKNK